MEVRGRMFIPKHLDEHAVKHADCWHGFIHLEHFVESIILETSVERAGVCDFPGAGHTRRPSAWAQEAQLCCMVIPFSFLRSCNAAMRPENRAIQPVALSPYGYTRNTWKNCLEPLSYISWQAVN